VRGKSKLLISAVACALSLVAMAAGTARADTVTQIPQLPFLRQMVVDTSSFANSGKGYIFMSGNGPIVVTDLTGNYVTTLDGTDGVQGIALSPDGSTLYATLTEGTGTTNAIGVITVSTVTPTTYTQTVDPLATGDIPYSLAVQSGKLWVSYYDSNVSSNFGMIGDIDLTTGTFEPATTATGTWSSPPDLAADPSGTGVLVAVQNNLTPVLAATFTTTTGVAAPLAPQATLGSTTSPLCSVEHQLAVVPGGQYFVAACEAPQNENLYQAKDLTVARQYATGTGSPGGVAINADGTVAVGTFGSPSAIYVYGPGLSGALLNVFNVAAPNSLATSEGLAWVDTAAGPQLAAMIQPSSGTTSYSLEVFDQPAVTRSALTLTTPSSTVFIGKTITLTGSLTLSNGAMLPPQTTVSITRSGPGGPTPVATVTPLADGVFTATDTPTAAGDYTYTATYLGDSPLTTSATSAPTAVTVNLNTAKVTLGGPASIYAGKSATLTGTLAFGAGTVPAGTAITITRTVAGAKASKQFTVDTAAGGTFKLTDTPPATGAYTYVAGYAGNATTAKASASHKVSVVLIPASLTVTTSGTAFTYEPTVSVTAHLGATYQNRTVSIYAQWFGSRAKALLKTGRVDSRGDLTITYRAPHSTTFSVVFSGDAHYAAKTVTRSVTVRAKVAEAVSGYYGSTNIGGTLYRLFHSNDPMYAGATVAPYKPGECVQFEVWEYFNGAWNFNVSTPCITLSKSSQALTTFGLSRGDLGVPYRIRADYMRSGNDTSNENADSSWLYFEIEP
jgi:hypothetical protein